MSRGPKISLLAAALLALAACATSNVPNVQKGVVASGGALEALGNTFVATSQTMGALCQAKQIAPATCVGYAHFVKVFQPSYAAAVTAWKGASDAKSARQAAEQVLTLSNQLTAYATQAAAQAAGGK